MLFYYRASISLGVMLALQESPDIVIVGKQSIDGDNNQTGTAHCHLLFFTCLFMHTPPPSSSLPTFATLRPNASRPFGLVPGHLCI